MPVVGRVIQFVTGFAALGYLATILLALSAIGQIQTLMLAVTTIFAGGTLVLVVGVLFGLEKRKFRSRMPISLFLWFMLLATPLTNILKTSGLYIPDAEIPDDQLMGAALAELLRYVVYIALIIWSGFSKKLKAYLVASVDAT